MMLGHAEDNDFEGGAGGRGGHHHGAEGFLPGFDGVDALPQHGGAGSICRGSGVNERDRIGRRVRLLAFTLVSQMYVKRFSHWGRVREAVRLEMMSGEDPAVLTAALGVLGTVPEGVLVQFFAAPDARGGMRGCCSAEETGMRNAGIASVGTLTLRVWSAIARGVQPATEQFDSLADAQRVVQDVRDFVRELLESLLVLLCDPETAGATCAVCARVLDAFVVAATPQTDAVQNYVSNVLLGTTCFAGLANVDQSVAASFAEFGNQICRAVVLNVEVVMDKWSVLSPAACIPVTHLVTRVISVLMHERPGHADLLLAKRPRSKQSFLRTQTERARTRESYTDIAVVAENWVNFRLCRAAEECLHLEHAHTCATSALTLLNDRRLTHLRFRICEPIVHCLLRCARALLPSAVVSSMSGVYVHHAGPNQILTVPQQTMLAHVLFAMRWVPDTALPILICQVMQLLQLCMDDEARVRLVTEVVTLCVLDLAHNGEIRQPAVLAGVISHPWVVAMMQDSNPSNWLRGNVVASLSRLLTRLSTVALSLYMRDRKKDKQKKAATKQSQNQNQGASKSTQPAAAKSSTATALAAATATNTPLVARGVGAHAQLKGSLFNPQKSNAEKAGSVGGAAAGATTVAAAQAAAAAAAAAAGGAPNAAGGMLDFSSAAAAAALGGGTGAHVTFQEAVFGGGGGGVGSGALLDGSERVMEEGEIHVVRWLQVSLSTLENFAKCLNWQPSSGTGGGSEHESMGGGGAHGIGRRSTVGGVPLLDTSSGGVDDFASVPEHATSDTPQQMYACLVSTVCRVLAPVMDSILDMSHFEWATDQLLQIVTSLLEWHLTETMSNRWARWARLQILVVLSQHLGALCTRGGSDQLAQLGESMIDMLVAELMFVQDRQDQMEALRFASRTGQLGGADVPLRSHPWCSTWAQATALRALALLSHHVPRLRPRIHEQFRKFLRFCPDAAQMTSSSTGGDLGEDGSEERKGGIGGGGNPSGRNGQNWVGTDENGFRALSAGMMSPALLQALRTATQLGQWDPNRRRAQGTGGGGSGVRKTPASMTDFIDFDQQTPPATAPGAQRTLQAMIEEALRPVVSVGNVLCHDDTTPESELHDGTLDHPSAAAAAIAAAAGGAGSGAPSSIVGPAATGTPWQMMTRNASLTSQHGMEQRGIVAQLERADRVATIDAVIDAHLCHPAVRAAERDRDAGRSNFADPMAAATRGPFALAQLERSLLANDEEANWQIVSGSSDMFVIAVRQDPLPFSKAIQVRVRVTNAAGFKIPAFRVYLTLSPGLRPSAGCSQLDFAGPDFMLPETSVARAFIVEAASTAQHALHVNVEFPGVARQENDWHELYDDEVGADGLPHSRGSRTPPGRGSRAAASAGGNGGDDDDEDGGGGGGGGAGGVSVAAVIGEMGGVDPNKTTDARGIETLRCTPCAIRFTSFLLPFIHATPLSQFLRAAQSAAAPANALNVRPALAELRLAWARLPKALHASVESLPPTAANAVDGIAWVSEVAEVPLFGQLAHHHQQQQHSTGSGADPSAGFPGGLAVANQVIEGTCRVRAWLFRTWHEDVIACVLNVTNVSVPTTFSGGGGGPGSSPSSTPKQAGPGGGVAAPSPPGHVSANAHQVRTRWVGQLEVRCNTRVVGVLAQCMGEFLHFLAPDFVTTLSETQQRMMARSSPVTHIPPEFRTDADGPTAWAEDTDPTALWEMTQAQRRVFSGVTTSPTVRVPTSSDGGLSGVGPAGTGAGTANVVAQGGGGGGGVVDFFS